LLYQSFFKEHRDRVLICIKHIAFCTGLPFVPANLRPLLIPSPVDFSWCSIGKVDNLAPDATPRITQSCGPKFENGVEDIITCRDYVARLTPHMDAHAVKLYGTGDSTQHVFRFTRESGGINPGGVLVRYKKYASDSVVEIVKVPATEGPGPGYRGDTKGDHRFRINTYRRENYLPAAEKPQIRLRSSLPQGQPPLAVNSDRDDNADLAAIRKNVENREAFPQFDDAARAEWARFAGDVSRWMKMDFYGHELRPNLINDLQRRTAARSEQGEPLCFVSTT